MTKKMTNLFSSLFSVNSAFTTLRLLIPTEPKNRKLSKIETLRLAKSYISHLTAALMVGEFNYEENSSSLYFAFTRIIDDDLLSFLLSLSLHLENTSCRQPCFEASKRSSSQETALDYRTNICTFCVSSVIHQKRIN
jgi:hypothetical protein